MTKRINFMAVGGGVGCTTAAAVTALIAAEAGSQVLFTSTAEHDDRAPILGQPSGQDTFSPQLHLEDCGLDYDIEIVDRGSNDLSDGPDDGNVLCLRGDYLSLRRAVQHPFCAGPVLVLTYPDSALQISDIIATLPPTARVRHVEWKPEIARAIDAGTLPLARPRSFFRAMRYVA
jgi:hypothetical protein